MDRKPVQLTRGAKWMSTRNTRWLWLLVAILALATIVVGTVTGYRADDASVVPDGETALGLPQWRTALWILVGATTLASVSALVVTAVQSWRANVKRFTAPAALVQVRDGRSHR